MDADVQTTLTSIWDERIVAHSNHWVRVDPGSSVFLTFDHFTRQNAGWGDYRLTCEWELTLSAGRPFNRTPYEPLLRRTEQHIVHGPRWERHGSVNFSSRKFPEADGAFVDAYDEVQREIRQRDRWSRLTDPSKLGETWSALGRDLRLAAGVVGDYIGPFSGRALGATTLMNKRLPPLNVDRWIQGEERIGPRLDDLRGRVILFDFMFTECPSCRLAMPELRRLHERFGTRGLEVVSVCASWGATDIGRWIGTTRVSHPVAVLAPRAEEAYEIDAYPTYVVADRQGVVRWFSVGFPPPDDKIEELLAEAH